jgi:hypothetical protein
MKRLSPSGSDLRRFQKHLTGIRRLFLRVLDEFPLSWRFRRGFHSRFRDLPLFLQSEAFPAAVLWYSVSCLHFTLNPVPPSTLALEVFPSMACGSCFHDSAAHAVFHSSDGLLAMKSLALRPELALWSSVGRFLLQPLWAFAVS